MDGALVAVLPGMVALGFRHGFDWDHIAAITDITSTTSASHADVAVPLGAPVTASGHSDHLTDHGHSHASVPAGHALRESRFTHEQRHALGLATLYALGHASMVVALGVAALLFAAILPDWVDPILERVVGVTLVLLGVWVLFSVTQYLRGKGELRLRSRWMLVFDFARYGWGALQARVHGHQHQPSLHATQYGPRTAFGVGTNLTNDVGYTPLQIVIKLVRCNGQPVAKLSDSPEKNMCDDQAYLAYLRQVFEIHPAATSH